MSRGNMICWMTNEPLRPRQKLAIKHTTRMGRALVKDIRYRLDVNTLHRDQDTKELGAHPLRRGIQGAPVGQLQPLYPDGALRVKWLAWMTNSLRPTPADGPASEDPEAATSCTRRATGHSSWNRPR